MKESDGKYSIYLQDVDADLVQFSIKVQNLLYGTFRRTGKDEKGSIWKSENVKYHELDPTVDKKSKNIEHLLFEHVRNIQRLQLTDTGIRIESPKSKIEFKRML